MTKTLWVALDQFSVPPYCDFQAHPRFGNIFIWIQPYPWFGNIFIWIQAHPWFGNIFIWISNIPLVWKCNLGIKQFSFINKGQHLYWQLKMVESVECNEIFTKFTQQQGLKYKISKRSANLTKHPHLKLVIIPPVSPVIIMFCKNPVFRKCEVSLCFNASYDHFHSFWLCIPLSVEHNQKQTQPQVLPFFKPNSNTFSAGRI